MSGRGQQYIRLSDASGLSISQSDLDSLTSASNSLVELIDLYPTLCDLAGLPRPGQLDGRSLVPLLQDPGASVSEAAFSQFERRHEGRRLMGYSMRTDRFRYVEWLDRTSRELDPLHPADIR